MRVRLTAGSNGSPQKRQPSTSASASASGSAWPLMRRISARTADWNPAANGPGRGFGGRLGQAAGMAAAGGRRAGLPAGDEPEGLQRPNVLADRTIDLVIRARAGRLLALLDGDLIGGRGLGRQLAQRPDDLEAGGRGERGETVTGAADRQLEAAFPVADGDRRGGRRGRWARPRGGGYSGHVRRLRNSLRTRPRGCCKHLRGHFHSGATMAPNGTPVYHNAADGFKTKTAKTPCFPGVFRISRIRDTYLIYFTYAMIAAGRDARRIPPGGPGGRPAAGRGPTARGRPRRPRPRHPGTEKR